MSCTNTETDDEGPDKVDDSETEICNFAEEILLETYHYVSVLDYDRVSILIRGSEPAQSVFPISRSYNMVCVNVHDLLEDDGERLVFVHVSNTDIGAQPQD